MGPWVGAYHLFNGEINLFFVPRSRGSNKAENAIALTTWEFACLAWVMFLFVDPMCFIERVTY